VDESFEVGRRLMSDVAIYNGNVRALQSLVEAWDREANGESFGIDLQLDYVLDDMARLIADPTSALLVMFKDEKPVGFMGIVFFRSPTGPQWIAQDHFWYVHPDYRGVASLRLLKAARDAAKAMGCSHIQLSASMMASGMHDKVCALYEKIGAQRFETTYIMKV